MMSHERLTAGKRKLLDAEPERLVYIGHRVIEAQQLQAVVARLRPSRQKGQARLQAVPV